MDMTQAEKVDAYAAAIARLDLLQQALTFKPKFASDPDLTYSRDALLAFTKATLEDGLERARRSQIRFEQSGIDLGEFERNLADLWLPVILREVAER